MCNWRFHLESESSFLVEEDFLELGARLFNEFKFALQTCLVKEIQLKKEIPSCIAISRVQIGNSMQKFLFVQCLLAYLYERTVKVHLPVMASFCKNTANNVMKSKIQSLCKKYTNEILSESGAAMISFFTGINLHPRFAKLSTDPFYNRNGFYQHELYFACEKTEVERRVQIFQYGMRDSIYELFPTYFENPKSIQEFELFDGKQILPCRIFLYPANICLLPTDAVLNSTTEQLHHQVGVSGMST